MTKTVKSVLNQQLRRYFSNHGLFRICNFKIFVFVSLGILAHSEVKILEMHMPDPGIVLLQSFHWIASTKSIVSHVET